MKRSLVQRIKEFFWSPSPNAGGWGSNQLSLLPRTKFDYQKEVGDALGSSVAMAPIKWVQRNFPSAPLEVLQRKSQGEPEAIDDHVLTQLIDRPNAYYPGSALWAGTLYSYITDGNSYWLKIRKTRANRQWYSDVTGEVQELWYVPHWMIEPMKTSGASAFITHYEYRPGTQKFDVDPENVIHFRNGIDPRNPRKGLSMIYSELREIFTDDEAANFCATLLRNMGVPGMVVSPDPQAGNVTIDKPDELKAVLKASISGERRGEPIVSPIATRVQQFAIDQKGIDFGEMRNVPEERICAAIGIPPEVVGFGTGLQNTRVGATMTEKKKMAWENCMIPMQTAFGDTLQVQLLPEFEPQPQRFQVGFNYKGVQALQDNQKEKADWVAVLVKNSILRRDKAQAMMGLDVDPTCADYLVPIGMTRVPAEQESAPAPQVLPEPQKAALPPAIKSTENPTPVERFDQALDELEAAGQSAIAEQFQSERQGLVRVLRRES